MIEMGSRLNPELYFQHFDGAIAGDDNGPPVNSMPKKGDPKPDTKLVQPPFPPQKVVQEQANPTKP